ncbi:MAG: ATP-dependent DNA helicase RecG, partial [Phycisphaerales bacterium]
FNGTHLVKSIHPGMRIRVQGKSRTHGPRGYGLQLVNPKWERVADDEERDATPARGDRLRPVYPANEGIDSHAIERAVQRVLDAALPLIEDHYPEPFLREKNMPALADAHRMMHRPENEEEILAARRRLAYDEFFLLQLAVQMRRARQKRETRAAALKWNDRIDAHIRERIPFTLTEGQDAAVRQIAEDLQKTDPANRLIQGDVGSGKTVVALYAMLMASASGKQAAMMAPTELLAEQHYLSITRLLEGSSVRVELLTGALAKPDRDSAIARIEAGEIDIVVGTHALLTERVRFRDLAVAVIDEQHRFGVEQRGTLRERVDDPSSRPHTLVMTATPIPRTLALTIFGDLDVSNIQGLPPGRQPITTRVVGPEQRDEVYAFLRERVDKGDQAYVVLPAIEESGTLRGVRATAKRLEETHLAGVRVATLHGQLKRETRERVMERFRSGKIDVLVATTVIEVGVDVPGANLMIVEQAERFGLAQLHQLRGRVGRGERKSVCILIGESTTPDAQQRLEAMRTIADGFQLAERDFEIRGPGEMLGLKQAGAPPLKVADFARDYELLRMARRDAAEWIERSPELSGTDEQVLKRRVLKAHGEWLALERRDAS